MGAPPHHITMEKELRDVTLADTGRLGYQVLGKTIAGQEILDVFFHVHVTFPVEVDEIKKNQIRSVSKLISFSV